MNNTVNFNHLVSNVNLLKQSQCQETPNNVTQYPQQVSLSQFPSFCGRKPLTENQKLKLTLQNARNSYGGYMFPLKTDIPNIMTAIKNFKTDLNKTDLLDKLINARFYVDQTIVEPGDCSAQNVIDYFNIMSGQPAKTQTKFAEWMSGNISKSMDSMFDLFKTGTISTKDLNYITKNLKGDDVNQTMVFCKLMDMFNDNSELIKHKGLILKQLNNHEALQQMVCELSDFANEVNTKCFIKLLSLVTEENAETFVKAFLGNRCAGRCYEKLLPIINKNNATEVFDSIEKIGVIETAYTFTD